MEATHNVKSKAIKSARPRGKGKTFLALGSAFQPLETPARTAGIKVFSGESVALEPAHRPYLGRSPLYDSRLTRLVNALQES